MRGIYVDGFDVIESVGVLHHMNYRGLVGNV